MSKTLILIPSRMSATRLPGKPLLKINGLSIISHVYKKAEETNIGEVYVASEDQEILDDVKLNGGKGVITSNKHKTGTDRIFEAYKKLKIKNIDYILNLQGDEPIIESTDIINLNNSIINNNLGMGSLACNISDDYKLADENIVKVKTRHELKNDNIVKADNFFRKLESHSKKNIYHHIGIYLYKITVLEKITSLEQTSNEKNQRLEQLRALENNIDISLILSMSSPIGIDTLEDYNKVKKLLETKN
tara:strand:- start:18217 stop:18957 length:741 start_codon:yes stop_codon:yes gene_type:complete